MARKKLPPWEELPVRSVWQRLKRQFHPGSDRFHPARGIHRCLIVDLWRQEACRRSVRI